MAELEPDRHASPFDAIPRSWVIYDENATEAVALGSEHESYTTPIVKSISKGRPSWLPQTIRPHAVILVMGVTGAGKTTFINCLNSRAPKIDDGMKSSPTDVEICPNLSRKCTTFFVEIPGFGDMYRATEVLQDFEVLQEIARFLCQAYANGIKITGIVYLHPITDCGMTGASMRNLRLLMALCGKKYLSNLVLATSMWNQWNPLDPWGVATSMWNRLKPFDPREWEVRRREEEVRRIGLAREATLQKMILWEYMLNLGAKMLRHDDGRESVLRIVNHIQSFGGNMTLEIQQEMMEQHCNLDQTLVGQQIQKDLSETIEQHKKELLELQNEYVKAMKSKDPKLMESIEKDRHYLGEEIAKLEGAKKGLRRDFGRLQEERKSRYQDDFFRRLTLFQAVSSPIGGVTMGIAAFMAEGNGKSMQELTKRTESCGEPPGVTSSDGKKDQDQRGAHGRTPNDSKRSSICSEESCAGSTPPSYPFPEGVIQPDDELNQCYDLLWIDDSRKAADDEDVQHIAGGSEGRSSMTDSSLSEDATDWGEDSDLEHDVHQPHLSDYGQLLAESQKRLIEYVLEPTKKEMIDRLMEEFCIIFNRNWPIGARLCPAAPRNNSPSTSRGVSGSENPSVMYSVGTLRAYEGSGKGDKEPPDDRPGEGSGDPRNSPEFAPNTAEPIGFACPYRKRNPRKYCVSDWRPCTLNPLKTVARVKGHLYRYHIIHQCQRCKRLFKYEEELDSHIETSERCDAILAPSVDGITRKMKAMLQCKEKAFPGQTEAERWKQIYQILFPDDEEVPDPYFEPVRDNEEIRPNSPDLSDLSSYEQYLRRSLPRLVRSALETEINNHIHPIEELLREQLPELVEHALSRAFLEYRTMADSNENGDPSLDSGYISNYSRSASSQDRKGKGPAIGPRAETSMRCTAYPNDAFESSDALSSPFVGTALTSNIEISAPIHQIFEDVGSSNHLQFQEDISAESLFSERLFLSSSSFPDELGDPVPDMMDMDSFNWEPPLQEGPCVQSTDMSVHPSPKDLLCQTS